MKRALAAVALVGFVLAFVLLAGCAELKHVGMGLELQPSKKEPFAVDIKGLSLQCHEDGQILGYVVIDGENALGGACLTPAYRGIKS